MGNVDFSATSHRVRFLMGWAPPVLRARSGEKGQHQRSLNSFGWPWLERVAFLAIVALAIFTDSGWAGNANFDILQKSNNLKFNGEFTVKRVDSEINASDGTTKIVYKSVKTKELRPNDVIVGYSDSDGYDSGYNPGECKQFSKIIAYEVTGDKFLPPNGCINSGCGGYYKSFSKVIKDVVPGDFIHVDGTSKNPPWWHTMIALKRPELDDEGNPTRVYVLDSNWVDHAKNHYTVGTHYFDLTKYETYAYSKGGEYTLSFVDQSTDLTAEDPITLAPGQVVRVTMRWRNEGKKDWSNDPTKTTNAYLAASQNPLNPKTPPPTRTSSLAHDWIAGNWKVGYPVEAVIKKGQVATFIFELMAPSTPGVYTEYFHVYHVSGGWIPDRDTKFPGAHVTVIVEDAASFVVGDAAPTPAISQTIESTWSSHAAKLGNATGPVSQTSSYFGTPGYYQPFRYGSIQYHAGGSAAGQAFALYGKLYEKWRQLGYAESPLGFPVGNRVEQAQSSHGTLGSYQVFEGGSLQFDGISPLAVYGDVYSKWQALGFAGGPLGFPTGDRVDNATSGFGSRGSYQAFEGGAVQLIASSALSVSGAIYSEWGRRGFATWVGFPLGDEYACSEGECQDFEGGQIVFDGAAASFLSDTHPTGLSAEVDAAGSMLLSWQNRASAEGINVYRAASPAVKIAVLPPTVTQYVDATAVPGTLYSYFLTAFNLTAESPESNAAVPSPTIDLPPTGTVSVNTGSPFATSRTVTLALSATDDRGPVASMRFSNDAVTWGVWQPYATTAPWTLSAGDGTKTVSAQFRDGAGNVSPTASDAVTLDATPPTVSASLPAGAYFGIQTVTLTCGESGPIRFTIDGSAPTETSPLYASPIRLRQSATVLASCTDPAGNVGPTLSRAYTIRGVSVLFGSVFDMATGHPIINAVISGLFGAYGTAVDGMFEIAASPGIYDVTVAKTGYATVTLPGVLLLEGESTRLDVPMVPPGLLNIATTNLPAAQIGTPYNQRVRLTGGAYPYVYSLPSGSLPPGLALNAATGNIAGIPTQPGAYGFTIRVRDATGATASRDFTLVVTAPLEFTTASALPPGTRGWTYTRPLDATGGAAPYAFSVVAGALPPGMSLGSAGLLSGTPTQANAYDFTVRVVDAGARSAERSFGLQVAEPLLVTTARLADAVTGRAYNQGLTASGGRGRTTWALYAGVLPAGIQLDGASGMLTGTTADETFGTAVFSVTDEDGRVAYNALTLRAVAPLAIVTEALPAGLVGHAYSEAVRVRGGAGPYGFSLLGALPPGLSLDPATGIVSGTPTMGGYTNAAVGVSDATWPTSQSDQVLLSLQVTGELTVVTSAALPDARVGMPVDPIALVAAGGPGPYTWQLAGGFLPAGLTLDEGTGTLQGTPLVAGDYAFTVGVADANGGAAGKTFYWRVAPSLQVATHVVPDAAKGHPYSAALRARGGTPPYTWRLVSGALPAGIAFDGATGSLSGRPTAAQVATSFTAEVADSASPAQTAQWSYTLQVLDDLFVATAELPNGRVGEAYTATVRAEQGTPPYAWTLESGVLPPGLSLVPSPVELRLEGTPTEAGTFPFSLEVADTGTPIKRVVKAFQVDVYGTVAIDTVALPSALRGLPYSASLVASGGTLPSSWRLVDGVLPAGLSLNPANGALSGVPLLDVGQSSAFRVRVTDGGDPPGWAERTYVVHVIDELRITTTDLQGALQGAPYVTALQGEGGVSPLRWAASEGSLPAGLTLAEATGILAGTPIACGAFDFTAQLADSAPPINLATRAFHLDVVCRTGNLQVTLGPPPAVADGAMWSVDGGVTWKQSGWSPTLPVGAYTVTYKPVWGWDEPTADHLMVAADTTTPHTALYTEIPPVALLDGVPPAQTGLTSVLISVSGRSVVSYRYAFDGSDWSPEFPVATPISLTDLSPGPRALSVRGKNTSGTWQAVPTEVGWSLIPGLGMSAIQQLLLR